mgnify:FL=1
MGYNRPEAKALAKQAMRTTYPHPMLVTLVYLLLTSVLTSLVSSLVTDPFTTFYYYVWDGVYGVEDLIRVLLTPRNVASFLVIQLLITVYQWIMSFGYTSYVLRMARNEQPNCWNLLDGFRTIGRAFLVYLLIYIFTTLWSLLFLVPAFIVMLVSALGGPMLMFLALLLVIAAAILSVIVTYRYRLAVYFLLDNPEMGALAAITESKRAMMGWKGELFIQDLSFLGWWLLLSLASLLAFSLGSIFGLGVGGLLSFLTVKIASLWFSPYIWGTEANFYDWVVHGRYSYRDNSGPDAGYQSPYSNF